MNELNDLRQVRAFVQVAESGSISAAARVLGIAQPTLSRQLQALERVVGLPLVRRDTHNLSLTEAGRTLLPDANQVLAVADRIRQRISDEQNKYQGHIRIVSVLDVGQWIVPKVLAKFCSLHPGVTAEMHLINRPTNFVEEGFDCGLLVGEPTDESLVARHIGSMSRVLTASPELLDRCGVPEKPDDLKSLPWLAILQPHFYAKSRLVLKSDAGVVEVEQNPVMSLDSITALREAVLAGAGFALLPHWLIGKDLSKGKLVPLLPDWEIEKMDLFVSYAVDRYTTKRLRAFLDFVQEEIPRYLNIGESE
ncbi:MAG: LysR family transcriptional regulator [Verrucomicrobiales bacterium]|nr:LysR family transcriptional regulator [Verrucomicrobiales bacterium]